jgi:hypothetical protein
MQLARTLVRVRACAHHYYYNYIKSTARVKRRRAAEEAAARVLVLSRPQDRVRPARGRQRRVSGLVQVSGFSSNAPQFFFLLFPFRPICYSYFYLLFLFLVTCSQHVLPFLTPAILRPYIPAATRFILRHALPCGVPSSSLYVLCSTSALLCSSVPHILPRSPLCIVALSPPFP